MVRFLAVRVIILLPVAGICAFILDGFNVLVPVAAAFGSALALYKLNLLHRSFTSLMSGTAEGLPGISAGQKKFVVLFVFLLILTFTLLLVFAMVNVRLLLGFTGGYLLLPLAILVNALTEGFHITKNNWGETD